MIHRPIADNGAEPGWWDSETQDWTAPEPSYPLRHRTGCAHSGQPIGEPSLSDRHCVCDPNGDKRRAAVLALERYRRRHVLWQEEVWFDKSGKEIPLTEMSLQYKQNVLRFLERRAPQLKMQYESELVFAPGVQGEHALDAVEAILTETVEMIPTTWLYRTPFVLRLEQLIRERQDGPIP